MHPAASEQNVGSAVDAHGIGDHTATMIPHVIIDRAAALREIETLLTRALAVADEHDVATAAAPFVDLALTKLRDEIDQTSAAPRSRRDSSSD